MSLETLTKLGNEKLDFIITSLPDTIYLHPFKHDEKLFKFYFHGHRIEKVPIDKILNAYRKEIIEKNNLKLADFVCKSFLDSKKELISEIEKKLKKFDEDVTRISSITDDESSKIIEELLHNHNPVDVFIVSNLLQVVFSKNSYQQLNNEVKLMEATNRIREEISKEFEDKYTTYKQKIENEFNLKLEKVQRKQEDINEKKLKNIKKSLENEYDTKLKNECTKIIKDLKERVNNQIIPKIIAKEQENNKKLNDEITDIKTTLEAKQQEIEALKSENSDILEQLNRSKSDFDKDRSSLETKLQNAENSLEEKQKEIQKLEVELESRIAENKQRHVETSIQNGLDLSEKWAKPNLPEIETIPNIDEKSFLNRINNIPTDTDTDRSIELLKGFHISLKTNRVVITKGENAESIVNWYAKCLGSSCRIHTIQIEPGMLSSEEIFGKVNPWHRCFEPAKGLALDFWKTAILDYEQENQGIYFMILRDCNRSLMDVYLSQILNASRDIDSEKIRLFHPLSVKMDDTNHLNSTIPFPPNLWIVGCYKPSWDAMPSSSTFLECVNSINFGSMTLETNGNLTRPTKSDSPVLLSNFLQWTKSEKIEMPRSIINLKEQCNKNGLEWSINCINGIKDFLNNVNGIFDDSTSCDLALCFRLLPYIESRGTSELESLLNLLSQRDYPVCFESYRKLIGETNGLENS